MQHRLRLPALIAMSLIGATASASGQGAGILIAMGNAPGHPYVRAPQKAASAGMVSAPGGASTSTTGMGPGSGNRPSVSNTSTPVHPGVPAKTGQ
jgi:hypothetical protein